MCTSLGMELGSTKGVSVIYGLVVDLWGGVSWVYELVSCVVLHASVTSVGNGVDLLPLTCTSIFRSLISAM